MKQNDDISLLETNITGKQNRHPLRFHLPHRQLASIFGDDWFALKAEAFARFFGTPVFLVTQTVIVVLWIGANALSLTKFDAYPFILLNLAFSLQAAYAAPLILLAQTRQADRDKANADADARHREDIAASNDQRLSINEKHTEQLIELLQRNTELTKLNQQLSERIEKLIVEMHREIISEQR